MMSRLFSRALLFASLCNAACDIPTAPPKWDTTFVVQGEGTTLSVAQLLPASVTLANNAFTLALSPSTFGENLGALCAACSALNGTTAPKPAFTGNMSTTIGLPADVVSAVLTTGTVNLNIANGLSFDPVRPSASATGSIVITITSGSSTLGATTITTPIPAGATQASVPVAGTISGPLNVAVVVNSPAGDATQINIASRLAVTATPMNLRVSSASVRVQNRNVNAAQVSLDVGNIDDFVIDNLKEGAFILTVNNPFNVTGNLTLTVLAVPTVITKQLALAAGTSTAEVVFSRNELRQILGKSGVTMRIAGPVTSANNVTVTPTQVLSVSSKLKLVVSVGDN